MQSNTSLADAAVEYATSYGWHLLPTAGKIPHRHLAPNGYKSASQEPERIRGWFARDPTINIAVSCRPSGLLVLDIDPRHGGDDHLHDLERDLGPLPQTVASVTGGGGCHYVFENPYKRTSGSIAPGVDIRDLGYALIPRSKHKSGQFYEWNLGPREIPIARLTQPWINRLTKTRRNGDPDPGSRTGPIYKGGRNIALVHMAGAMRRAGFERSGIEAALLVTNQVRCKPPLEASSIQKIARWITKSETGPLWATDPVAYANSGPGLQPSEKLTLIALCHRADARGRVIGGEWLMNETGLSRPTITRTIKELERLDCVRVERRRAKKAANVYFLSRALPLPSSPPAPPNDTQVVIRESPRSYSGGGGCL